MGKVPDQVKDLLIIAITTLSLQATNIPYSMNILLPNQINQKMKKKFNLNDLKVKSFVTSLEDTNSHTIAGGVTGGCAQRTRLEGTCRITQFCAILTLPRIIKKR